MPESELQRLAATLRQLCEDIELAVPALIERRRRLYSLAARAALLAGRTLRFHYVTFAIHSAIKDLDATIPQLIATAQTGRAYAASLDGRHDESAPEA